VSEIPVALVSGAGGLVGSAAARLLVESGYRVLGLENDMRARFFGPEASTEPVVRELDSAYEDFHWLALDVRDAEGVDRLLQRHRGRLELVVHAAAQPSHDWAARDPHTDFEVNATGTLNLLESTREHAPDASFVFISTNKVYGDQPNGLPLVELETRLELPEGHRYFTGIDTSMSIDRSTHSLFGVSKAAADLLVQEYGRYFDLATACLRCGCVTGPAHAGVELHGFLAYLMKATVTGRPYTVFGHGAKQVRDNIHADDLAAACLAFHRRPRRAAVYNLGGGRVADCSMLEAIAASERIAGRPLDWSLSEDARVGDHRWWISDLSEFQRDYPEWRLERDTDSLLREIHDANRERWSAAVA
jgi:CDP-paratose 2-epimerase